jgi:diaminopimelate epimerase
MKFFKYQGAGNDFILIDNQRGFIREEEKPVISKHFCDRHFGIGGDGLIFVESSEKADVKMRIFNPDGSEAEMCGNGIRCLGKFLYESGVEKESLLIETLSGMRRIVPSFEGERLKYLTADMGAPTDVSLRKKLEVAGEIFEYSYVEAGVPHVVIFHDDIDRVDLAKIAPAIRYNPLFPRGTNVNFVQKISERIFRIRTYERGVESETMACGTGITASGVAAVFLGLTDEAEEIEFQARGGTVYVIVKREKDQMYVSMKGTAEYVFEGDARPLN